MRLPEFTAEASLGNLTKVYALRSNDHGHGGGVLPQGLFVDQNGNIWYCDEIVGCTQVGHVRRAVFF
ncbi:MAG: hypothetical protein JOZ29_06250 [Deltaproteobacteria bacterium]|nr:hypothetical protein [Deltaproteobacteria bacterium]